MNVEKIVEEIEALREKATPGPLHIGGIFHPDSERPTSNLWGPTPQGKQSGTLFARELYVRDAALVEALVNHWPAIQSALSTLAADKERLTDALRVCDRMLRGDMLADAIVNCADDQEKHYTLGEHIARSLSPSPGETNG